MKKPRRNGLSEESGAGKYLIKEREEREEEKEGRREGDDGKDEREIK